MPRANLWIYQENYDMYQAIPNKSAWINDLLALLREQAEKEEETDEDQTTE